MFLLFVPPDVRPPLSKQRLIRVTSLNGTFADSIQWYSFEDIAVYPSTSLDLAELVGASGGLYGEFNSIPGAGRPLRKRLQLQRVLSRCGKIRSHSPMVPNGA